MGQGAQATTGGAPGAQPPPNPFIAAAMGGQGQLATPNFAEKAKTNQATQQPKDMLDSFYEDLLKQQSASWASQERANQSLGSLFQRRAASMAARGGMAYGGGGFAQAMNQAFLAQAGDLAQRRGAFDTQRQQMQLGWLDRKLDERARTEGLEAQLPAAANGIGTNASEAKQITALFNGLSGADQTRLRPLIQAMEAKGQTMTYAEFVSWLSSQGVAPPVAAQAPKPGMNSFDSVNKGKMFRSN